MNNDTRDYAKKYNDYINSKAWKNVRAAWLKRHPMICIGCLAPGEHLHHRTYDRLFNEHDDDLLPMCEYCHKLIHKWLTLTDNRVTSDTTAKAISIMCVVDAKEVERRIVEVAGIALRPLPKSIKPHVLARVKEIVRNRPPAIRLHKSQKLCEGCRLVAIPRGRDSIGCPNCLMAQKAKQCGRLLPTLSAVPYPVARQMHAA